MSNPFLDEDGPQPPKVLTAPLEIFANLRLLQQDRDPLLISFPERSQRYQTYLVDIRREQALVAFDELIPNDGERFLKAGEPFKIEGFHDGVRIAWECDTPVSAGQLEGAPCYWSHLPDEIIYHQRRSAYRALLQQGQLVNIELSGDKLSPPMKGQMLDISATGCKLRFAGNVSNRLQLGQVYERLLVHLPFGAMTIGVEIRHIHHAEKVDMTFAGMRFHRIGGLEQRQIERFVYQLQREARRVEKDVLI